MTREYINGDCMEGMKAFPDNHFDLAIVDPPYGIGISKNNTIGSGRKKNISFQSYKIKEWDNNSPPREYFIELFRVSKNQIVCGANYFAQFLTNSRGWIFWDKKIGDNNFSSGEFIYTSFGMPAKMFSHIHSGNRATNRISARKFARIHPTQKPVALYRWLLDNYAKPGDLILDTHVGSASSLIAFEEKGFEYVGFELDADYYRDSCKRLETFRSQLRLFDTPIEKKEYKQMTIV